MAQTTVSPKISQILNRLTDYLRKLYGERLARVVLFGSYARGEARPDSDIDVLVVLKDRVNPSEEIKRTSEFIAQLCLDSNVLISRSFTTEEAYSLERSPFFLSVRREGIAL